MDRLKKLGRSTGLDDDLGRVDEEARFGENIGVEESVSDGGNHRALDGVEDLFQGFEMGGFVVVCN